MVRVGDLKAGPGLLRPLLSNFTLRTLEFVVSDAFPTIMSVLVV